MRTLANSSIDSVPKGPTDNATGRWALMMINFKERWKLMGLPYHSHLYTLSPTISLCKHTKEYGNVVSREDENI
jgi:hypothetical protein